MSQARTRPTTEIVAALAERLRARAWRMASAESCTGGMIAAACTDLAGSSDWFERGVVSYSNQAKSELLGVEPALIAEHGAVSEAVARAMAKGALARAPVHCALAVTGVAGPGGGTAQKPVGTVWIAWALRGEGGSNGLEVLAHQFRFDGDRTAVRRASVQAALQGLLDRLDTAA